MAFWSKNTNIEPKRKHRWTLHLGTSGLPTYVIKTANKPSFSINETEHAFFGHKFYYPGMITWNEVTITLVDPIDDDSSEKIMTVLRNSGYLNPVETDGVTLHTISKEDSIQALGMQIQLQQYTTDGGANKLVETWTLHNPWIKDVKFGDLDYTSDDMVDIDLTLRYDWATLV